MSINTQKNWKTLTVEAIRLVNPSKDLCVKNYEIKFKEESFSYVTQNNQHKVYEIDESTIIGQKMTISIVRNRIVFLPETKTNSFV